MNTLLSVLGIIYLIGNFLTFVLMLITGSTESYIDGSGALLVVLLMPGLALALIVNGSEEPS